jgi:F-type H+-transporting ATPase subunit alpha
MILIQLKIKLRLSASKNLLRNVPVNKVKEFEKDFLEFLTTNTEQLLDALKAGEVNR